MLLILRWEATMSPKWYEDTLIMAPAIIAATFVTATVGLTIAGIYCARLILRLWKD